MGATIVERSGMGWDGAQWVVYGTSVAATKHLSQTHPNQVTRVPYITCHHVHLSVLLIYMPPKPTCKVVKREGQRGARIDPKGCKVRTSVNAQGSKTKEDKQGQEKIKRTTRSGKMQLALAGNRQRHFINNWNNKPAAVRSHAHVPFMPTNDKPRFILGNLDTVVD